MTSTTPGENAPPALFEHCCRTYAAMLAESGAVTVLSKLPEDESAQNTEDEDTTASIILVYEGFLTQLITGKLNLSVPYFTAIRKNLIRMGCIRQLRRGGGSSPSQWEMIYEPTLEAFTKAQDPKIPKQTKEAATEQQILSLSGRIANLEEWQEAVMELLTAKFGTEPADG